MMSSAGPLLLALAASACAVRATGPAAPASSAAGEPTTPSGASRSEATPSDATKAAARTARAARLPPDCPRGAPDPAARMAEGQALIEASMVGEHPVGWDYLWGMQALREAADAGYPPALRAWGRQRFTNLYLGDAPDPDNTAERQAYVLAFAAIANAARLGDTDAAAFFSPDILAGLLDPTTPFPERSEDRADAGLPMADIPTAWWEEARVIVDHHRRRCWP